MENQEVDILIGLPGSGKSYYSLEKSKKFSNVACVSRDKIRELLKVDYRLWPFDDGNQSKIWNKLEQSITVLAMEEILNANLNLVIDETHISKKSRELSINRVRNINPNIKINYIWFTERENNLQYRMETPKNTDEKIWSRVISMMDKNFISPSMEEIKEFRINRFIQVCREKGEIEIEIN